MPTTVGWNTATSRRFIGGKRKATRRATASTMGRRKSLTTGWREDLPLFSAAALQQTQRVGLARTMKFAATIFRAAGTLGFLPAPRDQAQVRRGDAARWTEFGITRRARSCGSSRTRLRIKLATAI